MSDVYSPGFCGAFSYSIHPPETIAWIHIDSESTRNICVFTQSPSYAKIYEVTLNVSLKDYPAVAAAEVAFKVTLIDPCLTTILKLPTDLAHVKIISKSGINEV
jgi:hypothetical protein